VGLDPGLNPEELEALGGAAVVVAYKATWQEALGLLSIALVLAFLGWCGFSVFVDRGLVLLWAGDGSVTTFSQLLLVGYMSLALLSAWSLGLHTWRQLGRSPALVAGPHGLRVHGAWPKPLVFSWDHVESLDNVRSKICVRLASTGQPGLAWRLLRKICGPALTLRVALPWDEVQDILSEINALRP
jgi:hypothetical protein